MANDRVDPLAVRRARFAQRQAADGKGVVETFDGLEPGGTGPTNRHGSPKLPPGQRAVPNWPILDLGVHPRIAPEAWELVIDGLVARPQRLSFAALSALEPAEFEADFHCVTTWSKMDMRFGGVRFSTLMELAGPLPEARFVETEGYDVDPSSGEPYTTNLSLEDALSPDVLLVHTVDGAPLAREHGGPVRMVTPRLYAWKGAKWIRRITLLAKDSPGFWERRGYSMTGYPWYDDRYRRRGDL